LEICHHWQYRDDQTINDSTPRNCCNVKIVNDSIRMTFLWLTIQSALRILRRNPLRAGLTMLGIVIGVGAVVGMVSLGQGATASVQREIASLGTNVLIIIPERRRWAACAAASALCRPSPWTTPGISSAESAT
jgi:hypothetical protein